MMQISPIDLLLKVSAASVGACESPPNSNAGPYVERVLARTKTPKGSPWCAAQVTDWGVIAFGDAWPVKRSASVQEIAQWAADAKCRYVATKTPAEPGDLFCLWYPSLKRYAHIGVVVSVEADGKTIGTVEGNTSGSGSREGWLVAEKTRVLTDKDRLVRWVNVLNR